MKKSSQRKASAKPQRKVSPTGQVGEKNNVPGSGMVCAFGSLGLRTGKSQSGPVYELTVNVFEPKDRLSEDAEQEITKFLIAADVDLENDKTSHLAVRMQKRIQDGEDPQYMWLFLYHDLDYLQGYQWDVANNLIEIARDASLFTTQEKFATAIDFLHKRMKEWANEGEVLLEIPSFMGTPTMYSHTTKENSYHMIDTIKAQTGVEVRVFDYQDKATTVH